MELDPAILKTLVQTFKTELEEQSQIITDGLLLIEKSNADSEQVKKSLENIFRAAHNIKGAARSVGIQDVANIAHHIESIFSNIQKGTQRISTAMINLCLESVDSMRMAMFAYTSHIPVDFDLAGLLLRLQQDDVTESHSAKPEKSPVIIATVPVDVKDQETIRVSVSHLNKVTTLVEEFQVSKIALEDHFAELNQLNQKTKLIKGLWKQLKLLLNNEANESFLKLFQMTQDELMELSDGLQQLQKNMYSRIKEFNILSNSLQEDVRTLRLIPVGTILYDLPRVARDLGQELNKQITVVITGDSVKMDKMVLEKLHDPILHLLRNAIDHGIGNAEVRQAGGKPAQGQVHVDVHEQGNQIIISIADDGVGIDVNKITKIALAKKIITQAELDTLSHDDILELIFRPGFSTKEIITAVSGRGVGLDVVKTNINALNGKISIDTKEGIGTTFYLRVPLTLVSERGLMVKSAGQSFVIPINLVECVLTLSATDIVEVEATQAIIFNSHPIKLHILSDVLGLKNRERIQTSLLPIIILKRNEQSIAFLVDEIMGEREIVVKPFNAPLLDIPCVAGGTLAGNGQVIIVLNTNDIMDAAWHAAITTRVILEEEVMEIKQRSHILVVDDSITTRTLEKNILEAKDYQVTVAVNGKEAWDLLQEQKFSLVITDVMMPVMDGFTLTENIKKSNKLQSMPVIIVTSLNSESEKKRGIDVGADAYIVKSEFESDVLLATVAQLV